METNTLLAVLLSLFLLNDVIVFSESWPEYFIHVSSNTVKKKIPSSLQTDNEGGPILILSHIPMIYYMYIFFFGGRQILGHYYSHVY